MRRYIIAGPFWSRVLPALGLIGIVMPIWRTCYLMPAYFNDPVVRAHEEVHFDQIDRDGRIIFTIKYLYFLARYGYWKSPYEVEAYGTNP
jgi:hypothetical protein